MTDAEHSAQDSVETLRRERPATPVVRCLGCGRPGWWLGFVWEGHSYKGSQVEHLDRTVCHSSTLLEFLR